MRYWVFLFFIGLSFVSIQAQSEEIQEIRLLFSQGDYETVIQRVDSLDATQRSPLLFHYQGSSYQALLRHEKAIEAFKNALNDSSLVPSQLALAQSYLALGQPKTAIPIYKDILAQDSTNFNAKTQLAELLMKEDVFEEALVLYQAIREKDENNAYVLAKIGKCYEELGDSFEAIIHYEKARKINPTNLNLMLTLINVYYSRNEFLSALRVAEAGIKELPEEPKLYKRKGDVLNRQEQFKEAIGAFQQAIALGDTTNTNLYRNKGIAHFFIGAYPEAIESLTKAYELESMDEVTTFYLGISYQSVQEYEKAYQYLAESQALLLSMTGISLVDVLIQQGATYGLDNQFKKSEERYETGLALEASRSDLFFHLAVLYDKQNRLQDAKRYYELFMSKPNGTLTYRIYVAERLPKLKEEIHFSQ